jgi:hypothetical protein
MLRRGRINSSPTEEMIAETDRRPVKGALRNTASSDLTGPLQVVLCAAMEALPAGDVASFPVKSVIELSREWCVNDQPEEVR